MSPKLTFNSTICMRFYYYVTPLCDSDLTIETFGPQDRHYVLLLDFQDIVYGTWQLTEVMINDPENIQVHQGYLYLSAASAFNHLILYFFFSYASTHIFCMLLVF